MSKSEETPTTEVRQPRNRRTYSETYKTRILNELDACSVLGAKGELLRREGLYYSTVSRWRQQMSKKSKSKRGRPRKTALEAENDDLKRKVEEL